MASKTLRKLYREVRQSPIGHCVSPSVPYAMRCAITLHKWRTLESLGFVRLVCEPDEDWEPIDCSCGDPKCDMNNPDSEAFGSIGQYCLTDGDGDPTAIDVETDDNWFTADSVWGHVGYRNVLDWRENPYLLDIMAGTIDAFRDAHKAQAHAYGRATTPALPAQ